MRNILGNTLKFFIRKSAQNHLKSFPFLSENVIAKRGIALWEFGEMIKCATGRHWFNYNGYGCWCGIGGSGSTVDSTDQ